ncbi:MAG TPA: hypothetical protein VE819_12540 [Steroidobacteraceae bacterium]|jgi:hypothetical protein|nr:hypothetical protein [Steroidobacteraceae bacterium]
MPGVRGRDVALVLWPSFLAACGASLLFFAAVDPALLRDAGPRLFAGLEREAGYALGFLFFWGVGALASALSVYLIRTARAEPRSAGASEER